jgi:NDP-sugar pyrophosphorylase family protein
MKVIIPIAGRGSRFQVLADSRPEYRKPKPLIIIKGKPMIVWALESLPFVDLPHRPAKTKFIVKPEDLVFISLEEHQKQYKIVDQLKALFTSNIHVILLSEVTRGATETALKAEKYMTADEDIIVSDSDHHFNGKNLYQAILHKEKDVAGIIPVFQPPDAEVKWSYTLFDKNGIASAVGEKDPILAGSGAYANIGGYYFTSGKIFKSEAKEMIKKHDMYGAPGKQEFYVAPLYDRLIKKGRLVKAVIIPKVWGLGTPKDVDYFEKNFTA